MKAIHLAAVTLVCAGLNIHADDQLTIWIDTALDNNPELKMLERKWEAAKQKVPMARSLEDPMVGVDFERMDTTRFDTYTDAEFMISQKLPWFGKRGAKMSVAQLESDATGFVYLEELRNTRAKVTAAFWDLWVAQRTAEIMAQNKALMEQFERTARARYETGKTMLSDALRAQVELAKMSNEVVTMEREVAVNVTALNKLLNADPNTPRRVAAPVATPRFVMTLEQMQEQARQYCCILLSAMRTVEARDAGIKVAKLESAPEFEFRVEARQYNGRGGIQEYDTGVFINFPWLWRGKYKAMVNEANAELEMARAELESELNMTMFDVKELHTNADTALRLMELYEKTVLPQARQLVEATRARYETGGTSFLELVDAQKSLLDAELAYERARAGYGKHHAKLNTIIGPWGEREYATGLVTKDMK